MHTDFTLNVVVNPIYVATSAKTLLRQCHAYGPRCSDVCTRWLLSPEYLLTYCQPVSGISGRRHLQLADRSHLDFPRVKLASYRGRSFAYAGPSNWNSLPAHLRDSSLSLSSFRRHLKSFLFSFY